MIHQINNIAKVEAIDSYHLRNSDIISERGVLLNVLQIFDNIPIIGHASCEISDRIENNTRIFSIKLQMRRLSPLLPGNRTLCFRLTTVSGSQFMMGCADKPFPVITNSTVMPSAASESSVTDTVITLESPYPLLAILD